MTPTVHDHLRRWLFADSLSTNSHNPDLDPVGEEALRQLMLALPEARPRPGFADRVMMASGLERPGLERSGLERPVWDMLVGLVLLLVGSAVASLPALVVRLGELVSVADVVSATADIFTLAVGSLATVLAVGEVVGGLYDALLLVVLSPPMMLTMLASFVVSTLTLRWLIQLLSSSSLPPSSLPPSERSSGYVPAH